MTPELGTDDSAEYQHLGPRLGLIHAPGYPMQMLLGGGVASLVPPDWGGAAVGMTALSALFTAAATGVVAAALALLTGSLLAVVTGAGAFGLAHTVWLHAQVAEGYALNNLLLAGVLLAYAWAGARPGRGSRALVATGWLVGVGSGNHLTLTLIAPFVLAAYLAQFPATRRAWVVAASGLAGLAGMVAAQAVLTVRFAAMPNHHMEATGQSALAFTLWWMAGGPSRALLFAFGPVALARRLVMFAAYLVYQFPSPALLLMGAGAAALVRPGRRAWGVLLVGIFVVQAGYGLNFDSSDVYVFYQPCYLVAAVAAGIGMAWCERTAWGAARRRLMVAMAAATLALPPVAYFVTPRVLDAAGVVLSPNKGNAYYLWPPKRGELDHWNAQAEALGASVPPGVLVLVNWNTYHLVGWHAEQVRPPEAPLRLQILPREGPALLGHNWAWAITTELTRHPESFVCAVGTAPGLAGDAAFRVVDLGGAYLYALATMEQGEREREFRARHRAALEAAMDRRGLRGAGGELEVRAFHDEGARRRPLPAE